MAENNNPIQYKDLVSPDNSITDLIKQLEDLNVTYTGALKSIKNEALQLSYLLKSVSGATEEGRKATKGAVTESERLAKAQRDLANAESENAIQIAELKKAQREANEIAKLTVKLNQSEEGSYNRLSAQYSLNKIRINDMTKAEREATEEGKKLVAETKAIYEEMDRLQRATGKNQLNVGNYPELTNQLDSYGDKLKEVLGLNNGFGDSLIKMAQSGEGAKGLFKTLGTSVQAFGKTLLMLLANPVFLAIAGIAGAGLAFKFWFDYNKGLVEATKLTKQFTGLAGDDLKAFRNETQAVADTFNKDFKEVLQSSNAVAQQFGVSQEEALRLVKDGFVAGADANGEYLQTLKEYPAYFKEAGLSASQFVAITAQAGKSGIYSDKAVDTIKEGNIRIREMTKATADALTGIGLNYKQLQTDLQNGSKTTFDIMQLVSEKLNELPENSAVVGTAIADIFGGPGEDAGLAYLKTLKDIDTNLDTVKGKAGELGKLQEDQLRSQAELNNVVSALFDQTGGTFESMVVWGKTFVNDVLISIVKGLINTINYFVDLYNNSILFRTIVYSVTSALDILWQASKSVFGYMIDTLSSIAGLLKSVFTFDLSGMEQALDSFGKNSERLAKNLVNRTGKAINDGLDRMNKKIKPITIPVITKGGTNTPATPATAGKPAKIASYDKPSKDTSKDLERIRKTNLDLLRKSQDAELELETNAFKKREQQTRYNYARQIEDLKYQLDTEKGLTKEGKESINSLIVSLGKQQTAELLKINQEQQVALLENQKQGLQLRLDTARKGSEEEYNLKLEMLEKERQLELLQNKQRPVDEQQSEEGINSKYNVKKTTTDDEFLKIQLMRFEQIQQLEQSEFDLLRMSEERKTRFRLNAEKERLQKILELNKQMGNKLTQTEVDTIKNTIAKIDQEIKQSGKDEKRDIYGLFGLNLDNDAKEAINESVNFAIGKLGEILSAKVAMADQAVASADKEVEASQRRLDAELQARANGYANDVVMAQKELDNDRKAQEKALRDKEKAVKQQQMLDTITQTSSLITASANIWASLSGIPFVGVALALSAIGLMWGSFTASKIKARQVTKGDTESYGDGTFEFLQGNSHQSGNDIDLGTKRDGTRRRAEGGEAWGVISRLGTRKYRRILPDVFSSLSNGTFANKYLKAYEGGDGLSINVQGDNPDMRQIKSDVSEIKEQGKRKYYTDDQGTVMVYKNLRRRTRNN